MTGCECRQDPEVSLLFLRDGKRVDYIPDEASIGAFEERLGAMIAAVCAGGFPSTPSYDCRFCEYRALCEEGEAS
jgi:hypothetical protein